ncbi:MAG: FG-GAP-like repeat-containing protein [Thermodesulfovibrionales bacterium]
MTEQRAKNTEGNVTSGTEVGQVAPDFVLNDLEGKQQRLSDYKGKVVMIYFAMWCGICRSNCHEIQEVFYKKYHQKGVEVFALDYLQNKDKELAPIVKDLDLRYKTLMDDGSMTKNYNGTMALTLLIDRQGVIRYKDFYKKDRVEGVVKELLGMKKVYPKEKAGTKVPKSGIVRLDKKAKRAFREMVFYGQGKGTGAGYFIQSGRLDLNHDGYDDIAFGNPFASDGRGEVMIHYGGKGGPSPQPELILRGEEPGDFFGYSLSSSDLTGDRISDLMVGAVQWRNKKAGAVYLFQGSKEGLSNKPFALLKGQSEGEWFGVHTAAGDLNGDGQKEIIVAAQLNSRKAKEAGAVYIFSRAADGYGKEPASLITGEDTLDTFGSSLEVMDIDGDGMDDLLAGAPGSNGDGVDRGAVYCFYGRKDLSGLTSAKAADARIEGERSMDNLGGNVTAVGDLNGDGKADIAMGTCNVNEEEKGQV